jgi:hypothetical protein
MVDVDGDAHVIITPLQAAVCGFQDKSNKSNHGHFNNKRLPAGRSERDTIRLIIVSCADLFRMSVSE